MFGLPIPRRWPTAALAGASALGFAFGAWQARPTDIRAQTPGVIPASAPASDYSQRVVAYIHGNIPVTREELGEFLIARHGGTSTVELLVNRRIIEQACQKAGISVTPEEVEADIADDMKQLSIDRAAFVKHYLKRYNKTLYEWKEDVIRPKLMLQKLAQGRIKVEEAELHKAFDAMYGEKVRCRMIVWPEGEGRAAQQTWEKIRHSEAEFASAARQQAISALAQSGGRIDPIGHGVAENDLLEKIAFSLKTDELSELFVIPHQGYAVLKCDGRVPSDTAKKFETERAALQKMVFAKKVEKQVPVMFAQLKDEAKPLILLKYGTSDRDVIKSAEEELKLTEQQQKAPQKPVPLPNDSK